MPDIKFSEFPSTSSTTAGDTIVGLHSGANEQFLVSASPTATGIVLWNANKNITANSFLTGYTTTATAAGTTVLTVASTQQQYFTGSTTQTVTLPVTSTLVLGQSYTIVNNSSGVVTVQSSGGNTIQAMAAGSSIRVTCILTSGTGTASWSSSYNVSSGGVVSLTGTANQVLVNGTSASAQTGAITLTLPQSIATSSSPTFTGLTVGNINLVLNTISTTDVNGNLIINPNGTGRTIFDTPTEFASSVSIQVASISSNADLVLGTFSSSTANASVYYMYKSHSTTVGVFSAVSNGDIAGLITARGDDGTAFQNVAAIAFNVQGTVSSGIVPGQITFSTVNTSGSLIQAMSISNAQIVNITNDALISGLTVGKGAGSSATNTVVGAGALASTNTNTNAVVIGNSAMAASTGSAANITAIGYHALLSATAPSAGAVVIGAGSVASATFTGTGCTVVGTGSCILMTSASNTTVIGNTSGNGIVSGSSNTVVGAGSLNTSDSSGFNTIIGATSALLLTDQCNTFVGASTIGGASTASFNVGMGYHSATVDATSGAVSLTTGDQNTFIGTRTGSATATCSGATCIGSQSLAIASTGATSGDNGPGMSFGSTGFPVGFRGDGTIYTGGTGRGYWRPNINGTAYLVPCFISGTLTVAASMVTDANGSPILTGAMSDGMVVIGSTGATPVAATLTAGSGISITNGAGSISIASTGNGAWVDQTTGSVTMAVNTGYTSDAGASLVTFTIPTTSAIGDYVEVVYKGSGGWTIVYGTGQSIQFGTVTTATTSGSLSSLDIGSCVRLRCSTANTLWTVVSVIGNLTTV